MWCRQLVKLQLHIKWNTISCKNKSSPPSCQDSHIPYWIRVELYCMVLTSEQEPFNLGNEITRWNLWSFVLRIVQQRLYQRQKIKSLNFHAYSSLFNYISRAKISCICFTVYLLANYVVRIIMNEMEHFGVFLGQSNSEF